jgi:hypothetical protein
VIEQSDPCMAILLERSRDDRLSGMPHLLAQRGREVCDRRRSFHHSQCEYRVLVGCASAPEAFLEQEVKLAVAFSLGPARCFSARACAAHLEVGP